MTQFNSSNNRREVDNFLTPRSSYYGEFSPQHLTFNANLQEFAHRISYISGLQTGGKLSPDEAYSQIKALYKQLKQSKKGLEM
ncbi:DUF7219 family protein [Nodosilinea nodulosa]|uniref:DUF7219 family protein n=1 Tax=Nodosilinea nodulosa TaxID=416001 RepID=UPI0002EA8847|nr:hypothetical protein [Nodosilinea nodulosa]